MSGLFVHAITNEVIALAAVILSFARFVSLQIALTFIQKSCWLYLSRAGFPRTKSVSYIHLVNNPPTF